MIGIACHTIVYLTVTDGGDDSLLMREDRLDIFPRISYRTGGKSVHSNGFPDGTYVARSSSRCTGLSLSIMRCLLNAGIKPSRLACAIRFNSGSKKLATLSRPIGLLCSPICAHVVISNSSSKVP